MWLNIFFKVLTKCFMLLKVVHETFFLRELDPHPDREACLSDLVSLSTPSSFLQSFLFCHLQILLLLHSCIAPCTPHFISKGDPPVYLPPIALAPTLYSPNPTPTLRFTAGAKNLRSEEKQSGFDRGFFAVDTIHFLPI